MKYPDYLQDICLNQVKGIKASCNGRIIILLNNGTLFINAEKKLENIDKIHDVDSHTICAISTDNVITVLTKKEVLELPFEQ